MTKKSKLLLLIILLAITLAIGIGFTKSFFTSHHSKVNEFKIGKVNSQLKEPEYNLPENELKREDGGPGDIFVKDPYVTNTGENDCYVYLEISIPRENVRLVSSNGKTVSENQLVDLFSFTVNPSWVKVKDQIEGNFHKTIYGYVEGNKLKTVKPMENTNCLIKDKRIYTVNYLEGSLPEGIKDIPVASYVIQKDSLEITPGEESPSKIWDIVSNSRQ